MDYTETRSAIDDLNRQFTNFKAAQDEALNEIKSRGSVDVVTREKIDRIDAVVTALQEKASRKAIAARRAPLEASSYDPAHSAHGKAFNAFLRKGIEADLLSLERKAMTVGSDPEGGYMVPHELSDRIVLRQRALTPMRQLASVMEISSAMKRQPPTLPSCAFRYTKFRPSPKPARSCWMMRR